MRSAFSLLTAIFVMLLIGGLLALSLSFSTQSLKQTSDLYIQEQVNLLAQSAVEYEILRIGGSTIDDDHCYNGDDYTVRGFDINTTIFYIGKGFPASCNRLSNDIVTVDSNGTVMIDVAVSFTDPTSGGKIRYFRRTLQKP